MRFCYHVQSDRPAEQLYRLVHAVKRYSPTGVVHVSHDRRGDRLDTAELRSLPDVAVEIFEGSHGDFSYIQRYMSAVDWLNRDGVQVDWLVNITAQDYPVKPLNLAEDEVVKSGADGFMEYWDPFGPDSRWPRGEVTSRYHFRHRKLVPLDARARRLLRPVRVLNRVQPLLRVEVSRDLALGRRVRWPFGSDPRLYSGSAFCWLGWPAVAYLREYVDRRPDVVEHFRGCLSPVEAFFQTIVCSSGQFNLVPDGKRYFDVRGCGSGGPRTLAADDVPAAIASGAYFAGPFGTGHDARALDVLDAHVARMAVVSDIHRPGATARS